MHLARQRNTILTKENRYCKKWRRTETLRDKALKTTGMTINSTKLLWNGKFDIIILLNLVVASCRNEDTVKIPGTSRYIPMSNKFCPSTNQISKACFSLEIYSFLWYFFRSEIIRGWNEAIKARYKKSLPLYLKTLNFFSEKWICFHDYS